MSTPRIACAIERGRRENLEDAVASFHLRLHQPGNLEATFVSVFDGVCAEQLGEVASALGARHSGRALTDSLLQVDPLKESALSPDAVLDMLCQTMRSANEAILDEATRRGMEGMATTAVCAVIVQDRLHVASVGDSRCHVCTAKGTRQITRDHSETQDLIDSGLLEPWEAAFHPRAHCINRYLGQPAGFQPDTRLCQLNSGDIVMLSTDGLTDVLSADDLAAMVRDYRRGVFAFEQLPDRLVQAALAADTQDNVSVLCYEHPSRVPANEPYSNRTLTASYEAAVARTLQNPM